MLTVDNFPRQFPSGYKLSEDDREYLESFIDVVLSELSTPIQTHSGDLVTTAGTLKFIDGILVEVL